MEQAVRTILIVGGGSAGWMAAAYLHQALNVPGLPPRAAITVVESPDIPRISVGEATIPSMRHLLSVIGVDELDFMRATDATFKQSIKYVNWEHLDNSYYHHPFGRTRRQPLDFAGVQWLSSDRKIPFMETCSEQPVICEMGKAPLMMGPWDMGAPLTYAYHMNAQKFADYLRDFIVPKGVRHIYANVTDISQRDNGWIAAVNTDQQQQLTADLYIDCTGFRAKLIEQTMGVGFEDCSQWLLCDRAVAMHAPYEHHYPGMVRPYTTATALSNGWVWDIPMQSQRSMGYVHSSDFISEADAIKELQAYQGPGCEELPVRTVHFKVGRRQANWQGNCVAIGLSGGFIEPLESTGLYLSDLGAVMLAEYFPNHDDHMEAMAFRYNRILSNRFYEVLDFINMHYCLSKRTDTAFWREVQKPERINDRLQAKLAYWAKKPPSMSDFEDQLLPGQALQSMADNPFMQDQRVPVDTAALWNHESYECILYGMHFDSEGYRQRFGQNRPPLQVHPYILQRLQQAHGKLPLHHQWLQHHVGMGQYTTAAQPKGWLA